MSQDYTKTTFPKLPLITPVPDMILNQDTNDVLEHIPSESFDLIVTDPPYGVNFDGGYDDSPEYVFSRIDQWLYHFARILKPHKHIYFFVPTLPLDLWIQAVKKHFVFKNDIVTQAYVNNRFANCKNNFGFDVQHILFAHKDEEGQDFNEVDWIPTSQAWINDTRNTNPKPYTYMYPSYIYHDIVRANTKSNEQIKRLHPNEKNPDLIEKFIEISSNPGDLVGDFFMGSASTAVSCMATGRHFFGCELSAEYYPRCLTRIAEFKKSVPKPPSKTLLSYLKH